MDGNLYDNDLSGVVAADKAHVWHHLTQHKPFEDGEPRIIVEGKNMRVWDQNGKEYLDAVSGGVWTVNVGYGRESIAKAVYDQILKMNYFAGSAGSIPGALFAEKLLAKMPNQRSATGDIGAGSEQNLLQTPHIDALAAGGLLFRRAQAASSWTWPSTASVLTGVPPNVHGVHDTGRSYLVDAHVTLPELFAQAGWTTAGFRASPAMPPSRLIPQNRSFWRT